MKSTEKNGRRVCGTYPKVKSAPTKSPWGLSKTRMRLQHNRVIAAIDRTRTGKKSIMPMRFFNWIYSRLDNWR